MNWGKSTGLTTLGSLHADTEFGQVLLENVKLIAADLGMKIVATISFKGDVSDAQIGEMVKVISDKKPDMPINHGSGGLYQKLIAKAKAARLTTGFMGVNSGSSQIAQGLGPLASGLVFAQVVPNPMEHKHLISREY